MPESPSYYRPAHAGAARAAHRARTREDAFYSTRAWRAIRAVVLTEEPVCRTCGERWSEAVDHILPRHRHPQLALERSNLQALCSICHNTKTGRGE